MATGKSCDPVQQEDDFRPSLLRYKASPRCCDSTHAASPRPRLLYSHVLSPPLFFGFSAGLCEVWVT